MGLRQIASERNCLRFIVLENIRRFALVDLTHGKPGRLLLYEAGHPYPIQDER